MLRTFTAVRAQPYESLAVPTHGSPCHVAHHGFPNAGRNHQVAPLLAVSIGIEGFCLQCWKCKTGPLAWWYAWASVCRSK